MPYIPADARWYIAEVILEHQIEDDPRNVVHVNLNLIEASSPDEAYDKSLALGREAELEYENTAGGMVRVVFRGLRDLMVVHDTLEDGAELTYEEEIGVLEERLRSMVTERKALGVFQPTEDPSTILAKPNYMPAEIARLLIEGFNCAIDDPE